MNKDKDENDWETPAFMKIRQKKPLYDSPLGPSQFWTRDEMLKIVWYVEPNNIRDRAIITLLWDLNARPHKLTLLRIGDIVLKEQ